MAMGRRAKQRRQETLWIAHTELPRTVAHPFYEQLNRLLEERGCDRLAGGGFAGAAPLSWTEAERDAVGSLDDLAHTAADRGGNASSGVPLGTGVIGGKGTAEGENSGHRCHDPGSECGHAFDRATRYGLRLRRVSAAAGRGIGDRDAHAGAVGEAGSQAREKGIE